VQILGDGGNEAWDDRSVERRGAFEDSPAEIGAAVGRPHQVDLFAGALADVADPQILGQRIEAGAERVPQPVGPYLRAAAALGERIAGGNGVVAQRVGREVVAAHVDAKDLAEEDIEVLGVVGRVAAAAAVADGKVEQAVRPEIEPAAIVVAERMVDGEKNIAAGRVDLVAVAGERPVAPDLDLSAGRGQEDEDVAARVEVGRGRETEQAALGVGRDLAGDVEEGSGRDRAVGRVEDPDPALPLHHENAPRSVGHRGEIERLDEAGADPGDAEGVGTHIGDGDGEIERRAGRPVADRELDQIDIVPVAIGRELEIGDLGERQGAAGGDREGRTVGAARQRKGQRVAVGIGGGGLVDRAAAVLGRAGGRRRGEGGRLVARRRRASAAAAPATAAADKEQRA